MGLRHRWPCPRPLEVMLSLSTGAPVPAPGGLRHPQRWGPQCRIWVEWCHPHNYAPKTQHWGSPTSHTRVPPHHLDPSAPTLGRGTLRHPPGPSTQPPAPALGGSGATYRCHRGWDDAAAASPLISCLPAAHRGVPPTPEQTGTQSTHPGLAQALLPGCRGVLGTQPSHPARETSLTSSTSPVSHNLGGRGVRVSLFCFASTRRDGGGSWAASNVPPQNAPRLSPPGPPSSPLGTGRAQLSPHSPGLGPPEPPTLLPSPRP